MTSLVSVTLVLFMLGIAAMLGIVGKGLTDEVRRNLGFIIKMERGAPESSANTLKQRLLADAAVERFAFSSSDDILAQEQEYLGESVSELLDTNPYAAEFDVKVKPAYSTPDSIMNLVAAYEKAEGVEEVITESTVIEGVDSALRRAGIVVLAVAAILLVVSVALINNTVSLSIYGRRFVIHTMKLVGATSGFIRRPFVVAGAVNGLLAGFMASAMVAALAAYASRFDPVVALVLRWTTVAALCAVLVVAGIAISALTSMFATNRYLRSRYDEMFLK
ncbi:MAG: permease-like cell division protein FtsX [Muribaculaceae bacterium]|nr:permease-like cell division protein FtsX [Muribaculaceae bacterium]